MRNYYKRLDRISTAWDLNVECVKTNRQLKKRARRILRKTLNKEFVERSD